MQMRTASVISVGLHAAVLLWAVVSFSGKAFEVTPTESLPVDLVSDKDFSEMTKGVKNAPKENPLLGREIYWGCSNNQPDGKFVAPFNLNRTPEAAAADLALHDVVGDPQRVEPDAPTAHT